MIYVGNLPYNFTADDLRGVFVAFDHIKSVTVVTDRISGRSKGFGFVEITNKSEALAAIDYLNGRFIAERALMVMEAQSPTAGAAQPSAPGGGKAKSGQRSAPKAVGSGTSKAKRSEGAAGGGSGSQRGGKMGLGRASKAGAGQGRAAKPQGGQVRAGGKSNRTRREE